MTPHKPDADELVYDGVGQLIRAYAPPKPDLNANYTAGVMVYRNNVRAAYLRVLSDTFPVIQRLVGEDFFRYLAHEYFQMHPPSQPIVSRYGDKFPDFLCSLEATAGLPYLPDTARLELAWLRTYHAAEADVLEPQIFLSLLKVAPENAKLVLHPSVTLLKSRFPVHAIWLHNKTDCQEKLKLPASGENIVVKRPAYRVFTETIPTPLFNALAEIEKGRCFGEALTIANEGEHTSSAAEIVHSIATMNIVTAVQNIA